MGDLLRSYGEAAAPGNAAALKGMGIPFKGPMTAPREEGFSSGENFRPMGDPQQQFAGQLLGDPMNVQPMIAPAARGAVAAGKYAGPELARGLEKYMVRTGGILPMDVYHGSPHRFPPTAKNPLGEFDASKIGTGEGAQAYGHGLYFAESPGVAGSYKDKLSPDTITRVKNDVYNIAGDDNHILTIYDVNGKATKTPYLSPDELDMWVGKDAANMLRAKGDGDYKGLNIDFGNLYKVDLPDEHIAKMLDWDKPLSKQSKEVKSIADKLGVKARVNVSENPNLGGFQMVYSSGSDIVDAAIAKFGSKEAASEFLRKEGIPGIRYLDQGSRAGGAGTSNFVVFPGNEGLLKILDRK